MGRRLIELLINQEIIFHRCHIDQVIPVRIKKK